jgi:hypothetical protein
VPVHATGGQTPRGRGDGATAIYGARAAIAGQCLRDAYAASSEAVAAEAAAGVTRDGSSRRA